MYTVASTPGSSLTELHVSGRGKNIKDIDLGAVFLTPEDRQTLALITSFDLSHNRIEQLVHLNALTSLAQLDVSHNHITVLGPLPITITRLDISHNELVTLEGIARLCNLRELNVSHNRLKNLMGLAASQSLQILHAESNRITSTAGLENRVSLRFLSLDHNLINNANELAFLFSAKSLEMLSFRGNPVVSISGYRQLIARLQPTLLSLDGLPLVADSVDDELLTPTARSGPRPTPYPNMLAQVSPDTRDAGPSIKVGELSGDQNSSSLGTLKTQRIKGAEKDGRSVSVRRACDGESKSKGVKRYVKEMKLQSACGPLLSTERDEQLVDLSSSGASIKLEPENFHKDKASESSPKPVRKGHKGEQKSSNRKLVRQSAQAETSYAAKASSYAAKVAKSDVCVHAADDIVSPSTSTQTVEVQLRNALVLVEEFRKDNDYLRTRNKALTSQLRDARRVLSSQLEELRELRLKLAVADDQTSSLKERVGKAKRNAYATGRYTHNTVDAMAAEQERLRVAYEVQIADLRHQLRQAKQSQAGKRAAGVSDGGWMQGLVGNADLSTSPHCSRSARSDSCDAIIEEVVVQEVSAVSKGA
ncbi:putative Leucine Rich repeat Leucine rich repeat [Trypanosoma vivax]|uniref:Leucine-rich repeat protein (LRRP) n=1 Tax=Trypanosoma vivax (strain Y486) TaxID=1055687 RepID=G0U5V8_TRYVY|nr:hypothetical protein TRVL_02058 [Trypanosoma vivax]KAH8608332.1 putative Leucine Rich repeat Leucine rich repeat [Trypanosoma vivax]CCC51259.1 conserved hypothetical protein [Trypanosoma vivax Y486]